MVPVVTRCNSVMLVPLLSLPAGSDLGGTRRPGFRRAAAARCSEPGFSGRRDQVPPGGIFHLVASDSPSVKVQRPRQNGIRNIILYVYLGAHLVLPGGDIFLPKAFPVGKQVDSNFSTWWKLGPR